MQSSAQATAIARQRLANLRVPPDAQQAAALLHQRNKFAPQQHQIAMVQAAARNATIASNAPVSNATAPPVPSNGNVNVNPVKAEQDPITQISSMQNGKPAFALSMPPVKRPNMPQSTSPPKASLPVPPNGTPQRTAHNLQGNDMQQASANPPATSQTPRQTPTTPQVSHQLLPAAPTAQGQTPANAPGSQQGMAPTPALASYHQGLANGQQNQMHTLVQGAASAAYPNAVVGGMRPVYSGVGTTYNMDGAVANRPQMVAQQVGQMNQMNQMGQFMQQQMIQNAYQMNVGGFGPGMQNMYPVLQQQMAQIQMQHQAVAAVAGSMYPGANGAGMQANAQAQMQLQGIQQYIWSQVDRSMSTMPLEQMADMVARAPDQVKHSRPWASANDREKARLALFHLYKQKLIIERRQAANAPNAANVQ